MGWSRVLNGWMDTFAAARVAERPWLLGLAARARVEVVGGEDPLVAGVRLGRSVRREDRSCVIATRGELSAVIDVVDAYAASHDGAYHDVIESDVRALVERLEKLKND